MIYPKPSHLKCAECQSPLEWDEWTETTADHEGDPIERTGVALYCTNRSCSMHRQGVDETEAYEA